MEDLLVSNVFGSVKYLQPQKGLIPIISASEDVNGKGPSFAFETICDAKYQFWPWIKKRLYRLSARCSHHDSSRKNENHLAYRSQVSL